MKRLHVDLLFGRLASISTGAFIYASLLQKLVFKEPFFQGYQRRLALSAGVQVKLQMDVFTPGKMERKEREMSRVMFERNKARK